MNKSVRCFYSVICFVTVLDCSAEIFYVDSKLGSDSNDGNTIEKPWKSSGRVNQQLFQAEDEVLFHRGREWESVVIKINTSNIKLGAYGDGEKPRLLGSVRRNDWRLVKGIPGVYVMNVPRPIEQKKWGNWQVQLVMEEGFVFYHREENNTDLRVLKQGSFSYSIKKQRLYIRPLNDTILGKSFYIGQQENIIEIQHANIDSLVIQDLDISLANRYGIGPWWQGDVVSQGDITIKNNLFIGNAFSAICLSGGMPYNNIVIDKNMIRENGAEGVYIGKHIAKQSLKITNNVIGSEIQDSFGWRGEGPTSAFNGDGIDIKLGNRQVLVEGNIIRNLNIGTGISYHSGDSIITNNVIRDVGMSGGRWPAGIMVDIDDDYGTSVISSNHIQVNESYGINVRGKAAIGPPLIIEKNWIELSSDNPFSQIGFTAMNSANVTIKNNKGTGGFYAIKMTGMSPNNIVIKDNNWGHVNNFIFLPNSQLSGLRIFNNYFCKGVSSYIEWGNLVKEIDFKGSKGYLRRSDSFFEENCPQ